MIKSLCVFCGASPGIKPEYAQLAAQVGERLALQGIELVYGGGKVGLMGAVASGALAAGGKVTGIIPRALMRKELAHDGVQELIVVETMHERKALMHERSQGFLTMPGGAGTLEELFEIWTWAQLGYHQKPCAILNVGGFYDTLLVHIEAMIDQGFLRAEYRDTLLVESSFEPLLERMNHYTAPRTKWADLDIKP